ncbi:MAG: PKD-like domain-containing protein, partial [Bacteroidales bacterium]|nr:PKD-like domain-containing protein [Bacteroidales bacterium]
MKTQTITQRRIQMPETGLNPNHRTHDLSRFAWFRRPRNKILINDIPQDIQIKNKQSNNQVMKTKLSLLQWMLVLLFAAGSMGVMGQNPGGLPDSTNTQSVCQWSIEPYAVSGHIGSTYTWSIVPNPDGGGSIANVADSIINVTWTTVGTCILRVVEMNVAGCSDTSDLAVTVEPKPIATASNNGPLCEGETLQLTGGPGGLATYAWTGPNGFVSALQSPTISMVTIANAG